MQVCSRQSTCDVAVVGAGVFGAWTAYRLAQAGRSVLLIDALGVADPKSSSGAESRIIRAGYGANELYTRFAIESLVRFESEAHLHGLCVARKPA